MSPLFIFRDLSECNRAVTHVYNVPCAIEGVMRTEHVTCPSREEWLLQFYH